MSQPSLPPGIRQPTYRGGQQAAQQPSAPPASGMSAPNSDVAPIGAFGGAQQGGPGGVSIGAAIPGTAKPKTEAQSRYGILAAPLLQDLPTVLQNFDALADPKQQALSIGGKATHWAQSTQYQQAQAGIKASVANIVYAISGANSTPQEQQRKIDELTPQLGDKPEMIQFRKQQLVSYVQSIAEASNDPQLKQQAQTILDALGQGAGGGGQPTVIDGVTIRQVN